MAKCGTWRWKVLRILLRRSNCWQTLEEGLDILEIMRNIHIFVARYNYNLNSQCFIEKSANAQDRKHLQHHKHPTCRQFHQDSRNRRHTPTINFVYQYLAQRFHVFSQFLFDDHISMLMKESRAFRRIYVAEQIFHAKTDGLRRARVATEEKQPPRKKQQYPMVRPYTLCEISPFTMYLSSSDAFPLLRMQDRAVKFNKGIQARFCRRWFLIPRSVPPAHHRDRERSGVSSGWFASVSCTTAPTRQSSCPL